MKLTNWKRLQKSVYERGKMRLHIACGLVRLSSGTFIGQYYPGQLDRVIETTRLQGGNKKRGLMLWAEQLDAQIS